MFTRKTTKRAFHPLTMALTVVILLAMLVPAAAAAPEAPQAPEWVHGVELVYPTQANPVFINPQGPPGATSFKARFNLTITGTQVDDVWVRYRAIDANSNIVVWQGDYIIAGNSLNPPNNPLTSPTITGTWNKGWYRFQICAIDLESPWVPYPDREWFCSDDPWGPNPTAGNYAVFLDPDPPGARLIKPVQDAWLSGTELLVGRAWDPWYSGDNPMDPMLQYGLPVLPDGGIKKAWFDYCAITNWQPGPPPACGPNDASWVKIADATRTPGVPYQYQAEWNTVNVPDDWGKMRFCAEDFVGHVACGPNPQTPWWQSYHDVFINNHYYVDLRPGWNLVSTPLMLYNDDMKTVLSHLKSSTGVSLVQKVYWAESPGVWKMWTPANTPPAQFKHGQGYWIYMTAPARLSFVGSWKNVGNQSPPEYAVVTGWNLIGYTPWGTPTFFPDRTVADYLQGPVASSMQALWRYNASTGVYVPLYNDTLMMKGYGYWLATARAGVIRP